MSGITVTPVRGYWIGDCKVRQIYSARLGESRCDVRIHLSTGACDVRWREFRHMGAAGWETAIEGRVLDRRVQESEEEGLAVSAAASLLTGGNQ